MKQCCRNKSNIDCIKEYDPRPKNKDGSIRWFLYRWDGWQEREPPSGPVPVLQHRLSDSVISF